ncbi:MAG: LamG domain-containing protein [bacterium]|nr:LamG domain-containing protein [bacterium]
MFDEIVNGTTVSVHSRAIHVRLTPYTGEGRVHNGLVVLYDFEAPTSDMVADVSGVGSAMDLTIQDPSRVSWQPGALRVESPTRLLSTSPADKVMTGCQTRDEITIEAWVTPANVTQDGPARIVTFSDGSMDRNFTLAQGLSGGQAADCFNVRLNTTATDANGLPAVETSPGTAQTRLQHVVYTRDAQGTARIYIDAQLVAEDMVGGNLSSWNSDFQFAVANEIGAERPWVGDLHLIAIYGRALIDTEVERNYLVGTGDRAVATLSVDPVGSFNVTVPEGEDLPTDSMVYTVSNTGPETIDWTVTSTEAWAFTSIAGGSLGLGDSAQCQVTLDQDLIRSFGPGLYTADVIFRNHTNGFGDTTREVRLTVQGSDPPPPSGGDRPGPHNTGPSDPSILQVVNQVYITTDGTVLENVDISDRLRINASNVTVRNFRVRGAAATSYAIDIIGGHNILLEDGEVTGANGRLIKGSRYTARRLNVHHTGQDAFGAVVDVVIEGCWVHHLGMTPGAHADGLQMSHGGNVIVRGNFFDMPHPIYPHAPPGTGSNAAILVDCHLGPLDDLLIEGNWFNAGNYTIYTGAAGGATTPTNVRILNNRWGRDFRYGPISLESPTVISGNVWDDTGELMSINNQ